MDIQYDVIIIGAGPAGLSAGIYASRAGLNVAMIESSAPGGKLLKTFEIENYPGTTSINGADLAMNMFTHSQAFNVKYLYGDVVSIEDGEVKKILCADQKVYTAKTIIIASGTSERLLQVPGEKEYTGKGVSYCAVCDAAFFRDKTATIIGGGNSALEEAIYLSQFVSKLNIVIRRDVFRADKIIQDKIESIDKIRIITKSVPVSVNGDGEKVTSITLKNVDTNEEFTEETSAVFPYIGADPNTSFAVNLGILDEKGYVEVNEKMETKLPGIYGAGDSNKKQLRQVVTACNDGAIAAQNAFHYIKG